MTERGAPHPQFPFEAEALNRVALHDSIIDLAEQMLELDDVRLYQASLSAKYANAAPDYEQLLHVDYANHTLVVPRADVRYQHVTMFIYLGDVTPDMAATRVVSREHTAGIPSSGRISTSRSTATCTPSKSPRVVRPVRCSYTVPAPTTGAFRWPHPVARGSRSQSHSSQPGPTGSAVTPSRSAAKTWPGIDSCAVPPCANSPHSAFPSPALLLGDRDALRRRRTVPSTRHEPLARYATPKLTVSQ